MVGLNSKSKLDAGIRFHRSFSAGRRTQDVVTCPALPGLVTEGETLEKARTMAHGAYTLTWKAFARITCRFHPDNPPVQEIRVLLPETA